MGNNKRLICASALSIASSLAASIALSATHTIDVMVLYTEDAENEIASKTSDPFSNIHDYISNRILQINETMEFSNLDDLVNFNLILAKRTTYDEINTGLNKIGSLQDGGDGALEDLKRANVVKDENGTNVHDLRDLVGADIVIMVVKLIGSTKPAGAAPILSNVNGNPNSAFVAINVDEVFDIPNVFVWAHEIGHILGGDHATDSNGVSTSARAHVDPSGDWGTVLADSDECGSSCEEKQFYSDPTKKNCTNDPTGNSCSGAQDLGPRGTSTNDNVKEFKKTIPNISDYKSTPAPTKPSCEVITLPGNNNFLVSWGPGNSSGLVNYYTVKRDSSYFMTSWGHGGQCVNTNLCDATFRVQAVGPGGSSSWCSTVVFCAGGGGLPFSVPGDPMVSPVEMESQSIVDVLVGN